MVLSGLIYKKSHNSIPHLLVVIAINTFIINIKKCIDTRLLAFFFIYLFLYKYEMIPIYNVDTMIIVIYHRIRKYLLIFYVDMIKTKPLS